MLTLAIVLLTISLILAISTIASDELRSIMLDKSSNIKEIAIKRSGTKWTGKVQIGKIILQQERNSFNDVFASLMEISRKEIKSNVLKEADKKAGYKKSENNENYKPKKEVKNETDIKSIPNNKQQSKPVSSDNGNGTEQDADNGDERKDTTKIN